MKVKIIQLVDDKTIEAVIINAKKLKLPSIADGWRFNFNKHSKKSGFRTYALVCEETPEIIEGCLIFQIKEKMEPYMAFIEIAPHNKGENKKYDKVAGCLIAFACRLSFKEGEGDYMGWLAFDVIEENKEDEIKLMALYCEKYGALKFGETTMVITPENGQILITEFLN
jgi:hypothetical protein